MRNEKRTVKKSAGAFRRTLAKLLFFLMMFSLLPPLTPEAKAASWMDPYLDTVVDWGVMRGDNSGNLNENRRITRAEFVTLVNRAFGYTEVGPNPFSDVPDTAWYAEDICIAVKAGYFNGTSATTASPNAPVTREQAAVLIARNLRLQGGTGDVLDFTDSRQMGTWSRGLVQEAAKLGIIQGYDDGSFKPKNPITRGQVAVFLVRALGTLIQEPGEHSGMGVYGHLTINSPGVTLKDSVVTGNLYLTGGVGLENLELENVTVKGRIVVCGAGESQKGESSVLLRNVTAEALEVDSLTNQFLSVRSEGLTNIGTTTVRTSAFVEDLTENGLGLKSIKLDGASGTQLQLAGNIKEVINLTPNSTLNFAQGVGHQVTVDEKATGSTLNIDGTANLKDLNLDVGTNVTGVGDINHVNINAPGSTVTMLPDTITVRPGITGNISKEEMDSAAAAESSEDPRILSGYPRPQNLAPKSAEVAFSTNKRGTLYWAVTALTDGSVKEEQLINPPTYSSVILKSGNITVKESQKVDLAKISGLTTGGSYYVSAVLVDNRGMRSPVKVAAFTTPDDTTPAFSSGYPYVIQTEDEEENLIAQARVMATKDCRLYYALLPKGSTAPTASDFKAASISGNLGYGSEDLKKNTPLLLSRINLAALRQETTYDLYLWLTDVDNGKSSAIKKLTFTTPDKTPPVIQQLKFVEAKANSITMSFSLSEPGTLYWAVVRKGERFYDAALGEVTDVMKESELAKSQIETGTTGGWKKGNKAAAKGTTEYTFTISGLEPETAYDLYYVAKDKDNNYNVYTESLRPPMLINTLDNIGPTVEQSFTANDGTNEKPVPKPNTNIELKFSEDVQGVEFAGASRSYQKFKELYDKAVRTGSPDDKKALGDALAKHIELHRYKTDGSSRTELAPIRTEGSQGNWVIDYRNAVVMLDPEGSGAVTVTFPYYDESVEGNEEKSALNLLGGTKYYFVLKNITDTAKQPNMMSGTGTSTGLKLTEFIVDSADVLLSPNSDYSATVGNEVVQFHMPFKAAPDSHENMAENIYTDLIFWCDVSVTFDLYRTDPNGQWSKVGKGAIGYEGGKRLGTSMSYIAADGDKSILANQMAQVKTLPSADYGIRVTSINGGDPAHWNETVYIYVTAVSGYASQLASAAINVSKGYTYDEIISDNVIDISIPRDFSVNYPFSNDTPPRFAAVSIETGSSSAQIDISLEWPNSDYYYVVAPLNNITTQYDGKYIKTVADWEVLPENETGLWFNGEYAPIFATQPTADMVKSMGATSIRKVGKGTYDGSTVEIPLSGLSKETEYIAYFVLQQGANEKSKSGVYCFRFKTTEAEPPLLLASLSNPDASVESLELPNGERADAKVKYMMVVSTSLGDYLGAKMSDHWTPSPPTGLNLSPDTIESYKEMSVIQAMATPVSIKGKTQGTVFDLFAESGFHSSLSGWFATAQPNETSITKTGTMNLNAGNSWNKSVNCLDGMTPGKESYWFVAMGQHALGSDYTFSAARYLFYPGSEYPKVSAVSFEYDRSASPPQKDAIDAEAQSYWGTVTITFEGDLFFKSGDNLLQVVDTSDINVANKGKFISSTLVTTGSPKVQLTPAHDSIDADATKLDQFYRCHKLAFTVKNAYSGASITFDGNLANERGIVGEESLALELQIVKNKQGLYVADFVILTPEWDNTSNR